MKPMLPQEAILYKSFIIFATKFENFLSLSTFYICWKPFRFSVETQPASQNWLMHCCFGEGLPKIPRMLLENRSFATSTN